MREQIIELIRREDVWVILVGRCPVPPWLSAVRFQEGFYVVDSKLLMFSLEDIKKYAEYAGFSINEAQVQRMYYETTGLPLAVEMCHIKYMEMAYTSEITDDMYNDFRDALRMRCVITLSIMCMITGMWNAGISHGNIRGG